MGTGPVKVSAHTIHNIQGGGIPHGGGRSRGGVSREAVGVVTGGLWPHQSYCTQFTRHSGGLATGSFRDCLTLAMIGFDDGSAW